MVVVLAMVEIALGMFSEPESHLPDVKRNIRMREHVPNSTVHIIATVEENGENIHHYTIESDANGFIKPSGIFECASFSIVFLGGSTTESSAMQPEARFPYLVGKEFMDQLAIRVNTYNGGVSGNNTLHSINILVNKVVPMRPTVVVLMHNVNDRGVLTRLGSYWNDHPTKTPLSIVRNKGLVEEYYHVAKRTFSWFLPNTHMVIKRALFSRSELIDEWAGYRDREPGVDDSFVADEFRSAQLTFVRIANSFGITPVLMTQARREREERDGAELHDKLNNIIRTVSKEEDILLIELAGKFSGNHELFYDGIHLNERGSREVAAEIFRSFRNIATGSENPPSGCETIKSAD